MREALLQEPEALGNAALGSPVSAPTLLVELPSWPRVFLSNLGDLFYAPRLPALELRSTPAAFWPDVFVKRGLPWRRFLESGGYHILVLGLLVALSRFLNLHPQAMPASTFDRAQVIYYQPAEYLPPLDTRSAHSARSRKADPEFSRQPIISVPAEADNHSQTIVTPPSMRLKHDVPLPNIVAWSSQPQLPIAPAPMVPASKLERLTPQMENSVVAPPPDIRASAAATTVQAPQPAVIAPPPSVENSSSRQLRDLNIGRSSVIAPAPQLPVSEQRAIPGSSAASRVVPQVVPPPPSLSASGSSAGGGRVVALNLHPAVTGPPQPPSGNRRGSFAATPDGHAGASGNTGGSGTGSGSGETSRTGGKADLPSGLYVGDAATPVRTSPVAGRPAPRNSPGSATVSPKLMGSLSLPRVTSAPRPLQPESETKLSDAERAVFGNRKFYSLTLNMPNLNSAGGSWVICFAELKQNSNSDSKQQLSAPAPTRKVDPAYPLQMMHENVAGTVTLYAVIHSDGTVGNIRLLNGIDSRLDQFASQALSQWQFHPATKNGTAVEVEATFRIPFHPQREKF